MAAFLVVRLHGEEVSRLELRDGEEYFVGRAPDCAVVLTEQRGISRQHFKLFQQEGVWLAESLSRFVPLQQSGETHETIELKNGTVFFAPPYEFCLESPAEQMAAPSAMVEMPSSLPAPDASSASSSGEEVPEDTLVRGNLEATVAGAVRLVPFLRIHYLNTDDQEVLKLEGDLWVAGRESACEIALRDSRISRKHFELSRMREGFFITDMGSSNGTTVNGQRLPPHEPTKLESGDIIVVLEIEMMFEIRDVNMSHRLANMPQSMPAMPPMHMPVWQQALLPPPQAQSPGVAVETVDWKNWHNWKLENFRKIDYKKHKIRILIGALVPVLLIGFLQNSGSGSKTMASKSANAPVAFEKLTAEQKNAVKDTFNLARNLYVQGKYELCLAELAKLHDMIPFYENSKELEAFCTQGRELVLRSIDIQRREKEKEMLEQQITTIVEGCKDKLKDKGTVDEVRECLKDGIDLNPGDPAIQEMIDSAQAREEQQKLIEQADEKRKHKDEAGEKVLKRAQELYKKGKLAKAIHEYERFIETPYPDLGTYKKRAEREVASIKHELDQKVVVYINQCKSAGEKNQYKDAYQACDQALKEDPNNEQANNLREQMLTNLHRDMKSIYEDSVLEESLGNVDSAKEKWKKIMQEDLEVDDYYHKARVLLKKYGEEM